MDLSKLILPKINELRIQLNLTDDEEAIFDMLAKGKSRNQIAYKLNMSVSTVDRRIKRIKDKLNMFDM